MLPGLLLKVNRQRHLIEPKLGSHYRRCSGRPVGPAVAISFLHLKDHATKSSSPHRRFILLGNRGEFLIDALCFNAAEGLVVGESKVRVRKIVSETRDCIFCAGLRPATTVDHQPARSLFDRREWPEGYAFPACEQCNQASKDAEHKLALLVRVKSEREDDPTRRQEFRKYLAGMRNNFPGLLKPLSANDKRKFFKSSGIQRAPGQSLAELHAVGIEARSAENLFETSIEKLLRALHWKHTGKIVHDALGVNFTWYTNAYFSVFENDEDSSFYKALPAAPRLARNSKDLSEQFFYRYGRDDAGDISAFLIAFRDSIIVTGIVTQSAEMLQEIRSVNQTGEISDER